MVIKLGLTLMYFARMDISDLYGEWYTWKIYYHPLKIVDFDKTPTRDGRRTMKVTKEGEILIQDSDIPHTWSIQEGKIIILANGKYPSERVLELSENSLVVQSVGTKITWYYRKRAEWPI